MPPKGSGDLPRRLSAAFALVSLGHSNIQLNNPVSAVTFYERAIEIYQEVGERRGLGDTICNLGYAYFQVGQASRSIECYDRCIQIAREMGNEFGQAAMLVNKGYMLDELGDRARAIDVYSTALEIFERLGVPEASGVRSLLDEMATDVPPRTDAPDESAIQ